MSFSHRAAITTPLHCQTRTSPPSLARFHSHGEPHPFSLTSGCVKVDFMVVLRFPQNNPTTPHPRRFPLFVTTAAGTFLHNRRHSAINSFFTLHKTL
ncbi:hypothetical protein P8452_30394 [Trifolium repens]|nr:hypothetical protein P8452_30394 [Trifolium repens]